MATANEKFMGMQYPLKRGPKGFVAKSSSVNQIKADMIQLLLTTPGERVMLPEFGTPLRELMFEPNDDILVEKAREMIAKSLQMWEPRVIINQIEITSDFDKADLNTQDTGDEREGILGVKILFIDPQNIDTVEELKMELPMSDGYPE